MGEAHGERDGSEDAFEMYGAFRGKRKGGQKSFGILGQKGQGEISTFPWAARVAQFREGQIGKKGKDAQGSRSQSLLPKEQRGNRPKGTEVV